MIDLAGDGGGGGGGVAVDVTGAGGAGGTGGTGGKTCVVAGWMTETVAAGYAVLPMLL